MIDFRGLSQFHTYLIASKSRDEQDGFSRDDDDALYCAVLSQVLSCPSLESELTTDRQSFHNLAEYVVKEKFALVRKPDRTMVMGISNSNLGTPDYEKAVVQHAEYCNALIRCGLQVIELPSCPEYPDSCFIEDTAIIADEAVVISNPGHPSRNGEKHSVEEFFATQTKQKIFQINTPGFVDGGDVMRLENHFYIGLTDRTNLAGAEQLAQVLRGLGMSASTVDVSGMLHLKTGITPVGADTVICVAKLLHSEAFAPIAKKVLAPEDELHGANCLSIGDHIIVPANCPQVQDELRQLGKKIIPVEMTEFQKLDGGLTCLSLIF